MIVSRDVETTRNHLKQEPYRDTADTLVVGNYVALNKMT
jgi:hypothetical protein